jgi:hypothetical protein
VSLEINNKEQHQHQQRHLPQKVKPDLFSTQPNSEAYQFLMAKSSRAFDKLAQEYLNAKQEESQRPAFPDNTPSKITEAELARDEEKAAQLILELKVIFDNHPLPPSSRELAYAARLLATLEGLHLNRASEAYGEIERLRRVWKKRRRAQDDIDCWMIEHGSRQAPAVDGVLRSQISLPNGIDRLLNEHELSGKAMVWTRRKRLFRDRTFLRKPASPRHYRAVGGVRRGEVSLQRELPRSPRKRRRAPSRRTAAAGGNLCGHDRCRAAKPGAASSVTDRGCLGGAR